MRKFSIRKPAKEDSDSLLALVEALAHFEHLEPPDQAARRRLMKDVFVTNRLDVFLAFAESRAVGYALYFYTYSSFLARPTLYLEDIFVLQEYRRLGIGYSLFLRCVREAKEKRCGRMEWSVLTWNEKAIRFYENKIGAQRLKEWYVYRLDEKGLRNLFA